MLARIDGLRDNGSDPGALQMNEPRFIEIETRIAYQEETLRELSDVLARQQQEIDRLRRLCETLQSRLEASADSARPASQAHEPPPHY